MPTDEPLDWPFPVPPLERRTESHEQQIRFLDEAHRAGFRPRWFPGELYELRSESGRSAWVVHRGRARKDGPVRWEVWLDEPAGRAAAFWVDDLDSAAAGALAWLRGSDVAASVEGAMPHIIRGPAFTPLQVTSSPR